jgi:hypothetical protein
MQNDQPHSRPKRRTISNAPNLDWRWIVALVLVLGLFQHGPLLTIVLPALGAYLAIRAGLIIWRSGTLGLGRPKETYWRGQRIDLTPARPADHTVPMAQRALALLAFAVGLGLTLLALSAAVRVIPF